VVPEAAPRYNTLEPGGIQILSTPEGHKRDKRRVRKGTEGDKAIRKNTKEWEELGGKEWRWKGVRTSEDGGGQLGAERVPHTVLDLGAGAVGTRGAVHLDTTQYHNRQHT
jgi:hypothetical protein